MELWWHDGGVVQIWCGRMHSLDVGVMIWTWLECVVQPTLFAFPLHQMHAQRATMLPSLYIVLHLPACTVRSGIAQCSIYPPSRPTLHQRHEQHTETSSAFVVHFAPCGTRLTLSQCTAEQEPLYSLLCLLNIGLWSRYSEPRVCLATHFHTISSSSVYFLEIWTCSPWVISIRFYTSYLSGQPFPPKPTYNCHIMRSFLPNLAIVSEEKLDIRILILTPPSWQRINQVNIYCQTAPIICVVVSTLKTWPSRWVDCSEWKCTGNTLSKAMLDWQSLDEIQEIFACSYEWTYWTDFSIC